MARISAKKNPARAPMPSDSNTDAIVPETYELQAEFTVASAWETTRKAGLSTRRGGRHLIPRSISNFSFKKYGQYVALKPKMTAKDWRDVTMTGYVASLSWDKMRPVVASGYWDLKGYPIGRERMVVSPLHVYVENNPYFRPGAKPSIWVETLGYGYALQHANADYMPFWLKFLKDWKPYGKPPPVFRDLTSNDERPEWWPKEQEEDLVNVRRLIAKEEKAAKASLKGDSGGDSDKEDESEESEEGGGDGETEVRVEDDSGDGEGEGEGEEDDGDGEYKDDGGPEDEDDDDDEGDDESGEGEGDDGDDGEVEEGVGGKQNGGDRERMDSVVLGEAGGRGNGEKVEGKEHEQGTEKGAAEGAEGREAVETGAINDPADGPSNFPSDAGVADPENHQVPVNHSSSNEDDSSRAAQPMDMDTPAPPRPMLRPQPGILAGNLPVALPPKSGGGVCSSAVPKMSTRRELDTSMPTTTCPPEARPVEALVAAPAVSPVVVPVVPVVAHVGPPAGAGNKVDNSHSELRVPSKRRASGSPEGAGRANPAGLAPGSDFDPAVVQDLMPQFCYADLEATSIKPDDVVLEESVNQGAMVAVHNAGFLFDISVGSRQGGELYLELEPWNLWNNLVALGAVKQMLAPNLEDNILHRLNMGTLLQLYATAAFHPEDSRGPLQKRLVARVAMLARDGRLRPQALETWIRIQRVLRDWETSFQAAPEGHSLPDFTACFK
ncbi:hypothetical protein FRC10_002063 [Ceratobasidium sp. 414]|nr:hypothetical protein FRC10_002063 [Ceratobasidium sp. 414]